MIVSTYHRNQPQTNPLRLFYSKLFGLGTAVYIHSKSHWTECRCVEMYKTVENVITLDISTVSITYQLLQAGMYIGLLNRHR
jgi:hypothetical protein